MALILGIDRFMSECRALTNFVGNAVATIVVARWEGALDKERLAAAMAGAPLPLPSEDIERHERSGPVSEAIAEVLEKHP
jgi:aerobic C4-dicarboxylate transport protein